MPPKRWRCVLVLSGFDLMASLRLAGGSGTGFCMDRAPDKLRGTGFTGSPSLHATQQECVGAGHAWCPLSNETDTWEVDGETVEFYWFSACCSGRQARGLIPDPVAGVPTCRRGIANEDCTKMHWRQKLLEDLVYPSSGYDPNVMPSVTRSPTPRSPQLRSSADGASQASCLCAADDPSCVNRSDDGSKCLVCRTRAQCSDDVVSVGLQLFKLHTVDLKTSLLSFSAWMRQAWHDPRLRYDSQCYGGLTSFEATAQSGSLENSLLWTPDLELYNGEESIWQGSIQAHLAQVSACSADSKPVRGPCGSVFWSRPGLMKALCKFEGLLQFPLDSLMCKLEVAAFIVNGRHQDVGLWEDNRVRVSWSQSGLTSGSSFQDYKLLNLTSERYLVFYDCCPDSPFPTLVYTLHFERARAYYTYKLLLPTIFLTFISFATFWMNPDIGERLGFGITVILAMLTNDVVAAGLMPVANEKLLMDYLATGCSLFGVVSLLETAVVLFVFHHGAKNWTELLVPRGVLLFARDPVGSVKALLAELRSGDNDLLLRQASSVSAVLLGSLSPTNTLDKSQPQEVKIRQQLYRQIFHTVDKDFDGRLSTTEVEEFCHFMIGDAWDHSKAADLFHCIDANGNCSLGFREFTAFCDAVLPYVHDLEFLRTMLDGFLSVVERKRLTRERMWQDRAKGIDQFCRWSVPPGFVLFLAVLFSRTEADLEVMLTDSGQQFALLFAGIFLLVLAIAAYFVYQLHFSWLRRHAAARRRRSLESLSAGSSPAEQRAVPVVEGSEPDRDDGQVEADAFVDCASL